MDIKELLKDKLTADNFYVKHFMEEADGYYDEKDDDGKQVCVPCHKSKEELLDNAIDELINDKTGWFKEFVFEELSSTASELVRKEIKDIISEEKNESHYAKIIRSYREKGVNVVKNDYFGSDDNEYLHVKLKINNDFYLFAQGDSESDFLYGWELRNKNGCLCQTPEQIAEFLKLVEKK